MTPPVTLLWVASAWAVRPTEGGLFAFDATDDVRTHDEPSGRVRVHWSASGTNEAPLDDADGNAVPDYVEDAGAVATAALDLYAATGFRMPLSEADLGLADLGGNGALDVYLVDFGGSADGNFGVDSCTAPPAPRCSGYLVVENDFAGYGYPSQLAALEVVVPHELFHGVQMAYHGELEIWASEGSAVWAERLFDPEATDFLRFADEYLADVGRSIDEPPVGPVPGFAYGTGLWFDYLTLRHDPALMVEILEAWEGEEALTAPMLAAVEARGDAIPDAWIEFATWNLATGERAGALDGYPYATELTPPEPEGTGDLVDDDSRFYPLATTYWRLNHPGGALWFGLEEAAPGLYFSVHPTSDGTKDAPVEAAVASFWGDDPAPRSLGELPDDQYWLWGAQPDDGEDSIKVRFCAGAETDVLDCFGLLPPEPTPPAAEEPGGCGCAGAPASGLGAVAVLAGLTLRRARPSARRTARAA